MKTLIVSTAMFVTLSSFALMGAHSFSIHLDGQKVTEQYASPDKAVPKIVISPGDHEQLVVGYSECGRRVTGRKITAKDDNEKLLKEWKFDGATSGFKDPMKLSVKELTALKQKSNSAVRLFYSSNEFPEGQVIASIEISQSVAKSNK